MVLVGASCPLLATTAAFGTLSALGVHYQPIVVASVVLVVAVGVDDVFLLVHAWRQAQESSKGSTILL